MVSTISKEFYGKDWSRLAFRIVLGIFILFCLFILLSSLVSARLVINGRVYLQNNSIDASQIVNAPWLNSSNLSNYYTKSESNALFVENESDPIFLAYNGTIWLAINTKLDANDQRYNDTNYINTLLLSYLLITDQRYNDTLLFDYLNSITLKNNGSQVLNGNLLVNGNLSVVGSYVNLTVINQFINGSILPDANNTFNLGSSDMRWNIVYASEVQAYLNASYVTNAPWLLESDQRYNDTLFVLNQLVNYYNITQIDNLFNSLNASLQSEINARISNDSYILGLIGNLSFNTTETDPIFTSENATIWSAINGKLDINDQRYNDTLLIYLVNSSLYFELDNKLNITDQRYNDTLFILNQLANYYNITQIDNLFSTLNSSLQSEINARLNNDTYILGLIGNITVLSADPSSAYLSNDSQYVYFNETKLNQNINNISKIRHQQYIDYVNVSGGSGTKISNVTINYLITNVKINGVATSFRSQVTEYPSNNIIDRNIIPHNQNWSIEKNYAINSTVLTNITNSNADGMFQIIIDYLQNGVE